MILNDFMKTVAIGTPYQVLENDMTPIYENKSSMLNIDKDDLNILSKYLDKEIETISFDENKILVLLKYWTKK